MTAINASTVKSKLETLVALARLLEKVDRSARPLAADQYRSLIGRVNALLGDDLPADAIKAIVSHFPATAELYENLNYAHAGLVCAPLAESVEAERVAQLAIARWRRVPG